MNKMNLFNKCRKYNVVSFDIFDTLLKRDVFFPADVFKLVEKKYENSSQLKRSNFSEKRQIAEKKAKEISQYDEITLDEIYAEIDFSENEKKIFKQLELEMESAVLHKNPDVFDCYKRCVESGKNIYIVSDMYLPLDFLEGILRREGITEYKKLFLSCIYRKTKRSGLLFAAMCEEENISVKEMIHIGDSRYADFFGCRKCGIHGLHIKRNTMNTIYMNCFRNTENFAKRCLYSFVNTHVNEFSDRPFRLGYEVLGPIIYFYCQQLHKIVTKRKKNEKIWFAARDMFLFYKAYRHIFGEIDDVEYIYLSRKSLRPIYAQAVDNITKSGDIFARGLYSLREIIEYLEYTVEDVISDTDIDINIKKYDIRKLDQYPEVVKVLTSTVISEHEKELSFKGEKYLSEYNLFDQNIILADVGWHGTTQKILHKIQAKKNKEISLYGVYIGCLDGTKEKIGESNFKSLIFDEGDESWFAKGIILFESLILAPHGSTRCYEISNGENVPVLSEKEQISTFISDVQQGATKFIEDFSDSVLGELIKLNANAVSEAFEKMTCKPQKEELKAIGDIEYDNFYCNKIASPQRLIYYIVHLNELKKDFKYSPWRIGFLYRLFKIKLPYAKMYACIRHKQGKMT